MGNAHRVRASVEKGSLMTMLTSCDSLVLFWSTKRHDVLSNALVPRENDSNELIEFLLGFEFNFFWEKIYYVWLNEWNYNWISERRKKANIYFGIKIIVNWKVSAEFNQKKS